MLTVREIEIRDIPQIANYWLQSKPDFLINMGVDLAKIPTREALTSMLLQQIKTPVHQKLSYALIWELDQVTIGHSNINKIIFGQEAYMHLHLWKFNSRRKGLGLQLVELSLPYYFEKFKLHQLFCEPYALNPAPNKTLKKVGFQLNKRYITIPGSLNFEQEVNQWVLTKEAYLKRFKTP